MFLKPRTGPSLVIHEWPGLHPKLTCRVARSAQRGQDSEEAGALGNVTRRNVFPRIRRRPAAQRPDGWIGPGDEEVGPNALRGSAMTGAASAATRVPQRRWRRRSPDRVAGPREQQAAACEPFSLTSRRRSGATDPSLAQGDDRQPEIQVVPVP